MKFAKSNLFPGTVGCCVFPSVLCVRAEALLTCGVGSVWFCSGLVPAAAVFSISGGLRAMTYCWTCLCSSVRHFNSALSASSMVASILYEESILSQAVINALLV